jgi:simple sugar transport system permease protein
MQILLTYAFLTALISGAVTAAVPLLLAGLGEQISEKAGVLNIGIEGMMLLGCYTGFVATWMSGSFPLGFLAGGLGGVAVAALMVLLGVRQGLNQIVIGIALTLGIQGLTALLYFARFARTYPRLAPYPAWPLPLLSRIPVLGPGLFDHDVICYLGVLLVPLLTLLYRRSAVGLNLEAAGNSPAALDGAGVDVITTRSLAVLATGFLAGLGGAHLAVVGAGLFIPFMTHGSGFIGIVLAMLSRGRPLWVLIVSALFGLSLSLTTALQVAGIEVPTDVVQMLPFGVVMLVLIVFARHSVLPRALGQPYVRGER